MARTKSLLGDKANFIRNTCISMWVTTHADNAIICPTRAKRAWAKLHTQTMS